MAQFDNLFVQNCAEVASFVGVFQPFEPHLVERFESFFCGCDVCLQVVEIRVRHVVGRQLFLETFAYKYHFFCNGYQLFGFDAGEFLRREVFFRLFFGRYDYGEVQEEIPDHCDQFFFRFVFLERFFLYFFREVLVVGKFLELGEPFFERVDVFLTRAKFREVFEWQYTPLLISNPSI